MRALIFSLVFLISNGAYADDTISSELQSNIVEWLASSQFASPPAKVVFFLPPLQIDVPQGVAGPNFSQSLGNLADDVPLPSQNYSPSGLTVSNVYLDILQNHKVESLTLTTDQKDALQDAECVLLKHYCCLYRFFFGIPKEREPSRRLLRYQEMSTQVAELKTELLAETDEEEKKETLIQLVRAEQEWDRCGNRRKVEHALATFSAIENLNPERFWDDLNHKFTLGSKEINGEFVPQTNFDPSVNQWDLPSGWSAWSHGDFTGQFKVVEIVRNWMNIDAVINNQWTWNDGTFKIDGIQVSKGLGFEQAPSMQELMPLLPTYVMLAKAIVLNGKAVDEGPVIIGMICRIIPRMPSGSPN